MTTKSDLHYLTHRSHIIILLHATQYVHAYYVHKHNIVVIFSYLRLPTFIPK